MEELDSSDLRSRYESTTYSDKIEIEHNKAMKIVDSMAEAPEFKEVDKLATSYINNLGSELKLEY